ncbi:MAG: response regulator transcription factor [Pseudomonas prosekii]|jgi:two-component system response regulator EvgA|uniref:DNA-binding response regulator n=1 Tax=Pseudomonas prosekii TaxID=1148509 RepID=A0A3L8CSR7_9PSED|nr:MULTISPECIES: response regulator transcription factor [Pseudomonas]RLU07323.1 DNA-binding response regulator [Pseudomonas prosekii]RLU10859.1 DNA-binding response regulator [Pseudomonas prosekii]TWD51539.1 LuxR family two component transcriptional regulator [Pseudomonas sp. SJZ131]
MKSALIVDDHPVVRAAVKIVLEQEGFKKIHEASSGNEVMSLLREHSPDLLVLDLVMPSLDGLDVLERIKTGELSCRVLTFSSLDPQHFQERCMRAGALAYVSKTNDLSQLHKAVQAVMAGYTYFARLPSASLNNVQHSETYMIDSLSNRELTICQHLARGLSNKAIAEVMHLSHKTVSTYKTRLIEKLRVSSAVHLREFAKRNHLI